MPGSHGSVVLVGGKLGRRGRVRHLGLMDRLHIVWSPLYEVDIGPHVFPTRKYRLVRDLLLGEGVVDESCFVSPEPASWDELARVHTPEYLGKIREDDLSPLERMRLEVPFSAARSEASILCCG